MKHNKNILAPMLVVPALLAFASRGEDVGFRPEQGLELSKRVVSQSEVSLDEMTMSLNGQEMDPSMFSMEMTTSVKQIVAVTDRYAEPGAGRPAKLVRTFDELSSATEIAMSNPMMGEMDAELDGQSDLEGLTVVFDWNADNEEYDVSFGEDSSGDEGLLEGLVEAMDLREMLPDGEVSEGDTWEIDPDVLRQAFAPGGAVKIEPDDDSMGDMMGMSGPQPSPDQFLGEIEGEVSAEFGGVRDADGTRVAVVKLAIDVNSAKDLSEMIADMMADAPFPEGVEIEMDVESFDMEFLFEGTGELLWNLEAGVMHSLEISGEITQIIDTSMNMNMNGNEQAIEQSMTMSGSQSVSVTTG